MVCNYCEGVRKKEAPGSWTEWYSGSGFNFLIMNLTARLSGGNVMMISETKWPDYMILHNFFILDSERCFMRQQNENIPSSAIIFHPFTFHSLSSLLHAKYNQ